MNIFSKLGAIPSELWQDEQMLSCPWVCNSDFVIHHNLGSEVAITLKAAECPVHVWWCLALSVEQWRQQFVWYWHLFFLFFPDQKVQWIAAVTVWGFGELTGRRSSSGQGASILKGIKGCKLSSGWPGCFDALVQSWVLPKHLKMWLWVKNRVQKSQSILSY